MEASYCLLVLGLVEALRRESLSYDEAARILFSPAVLRRLNEAGATQDLIDIIHLGTELEDVANLVPDDLERSFDEISERTQQLLQRSNLQFTTVGEDELIKSWAATPRGE